MDIAYSTEFGDIVDSEKAYELFWEGHISNPKSFQCSGLNCEANATCVNLQKKIQEMKQGVHFRVIGDHSDKCSYKNEQILSQSQLKSIVTPNAHKDEILDYFHLNRPENYYDKKKTDLINISETKQRFWKSDTNSDSKRKYSPRNYYSISPIVTKFLSSQVKVDRIKIRLKNNRDISYNQFFNKVSESIFENTSKYPRIYFGEATVRKVKGENIVLFFKEGMAIDDSDSRLTTSIFISKKIIDNTENSIWKRKLKVIMDNIGTSLNVFIYNKPIKNQDYINFQASNLDFLDIRKI